MTAIIGKQSLRFENPVYMISCASIGGKKEAEGPFGKHLDLVQKENDPVCKTWEEAESQMQQKTASLAIKKSGLQPSGIRYLFAGDLLGQLIASTFGLQELEIPFFGLYGACSTCGESLSLGSMTIAGGFAEHVLCVTSSHFASAEKQFRFPLEYGNQRPASATWTVTGSAAFVLSAVRSEKALLKITGITTGKIMDAGIKDSMNMGAAMAPAAADLIEWHLKDYDRRPEDYDRIITGDLGTVGRELLLNLLKEKGYDIAKQYLDCGMLIYDSENQKVDAGGSGCGCSALVLSTYLQSQLKKGEWKRILFLPTGALLSTISFNEGKSVPGIAHGLVLEAL